MQQYPDSLLSKILGVYQVRIKKQSPIIFFITENVIGDDFHLIRALYDLKGATFDRRTAENDDDESGLRVLKDENFIENGSDLEIDPAYRDKIIEMVKLDSRLLAKYDLIDYSMLLIEVDSNERQREAVDGATKALGYDEQSGLYEVRKISEAKEDAAIANFENQLTPNRDE